jgi:hypothetical protein
MFTLHAQPGMSKKAEAVMTFDTPPQTRLDSRQGPPTLAGSLAHEGP